MCSKYKPCIRGKLSFSFDVVRHPLDKLVIRLSDGLGTNAIAEHSCNAKVDPDADEASDLSSVNGHRHGHGKRPFPA